MGFKGADGPPEAAHQPLFSGDAEGIPRKKGIIS